MLITRFGHAALLLESNGSRVLIDPGAFSVDETFALTGLDAIIVTHQHPDHLDRDRAQALIAANPEAVLVCDPETADQVDFGNWTVNGDGQTLSFGEFTMTGVGAQHAVILPELPRVANVGVLVRDRSGTTLFHPGDTYEYVPGNVDVLAVPLSAPWAKLSETVAFVQAVGASTVLPIHDKTVSELAYPLYWGQIANFGGTDDARLLDQTASTEV